MSACYERNDFLVIGLGRQPFGHLAAPAEDDHAVGNLEDIGYVVADQDHGAAATGEPAGELQHLARFDDGKRRGRLVHDDEPGIQIERPADGDGLALTARQAADGRFRIGNMGIEFFQQAIDALAHFLTLQERNAQNGAFQFAAEKHVFGDGQVLRERQFLEDRRDPRRRRVLGRMKGDRIALDDEFAIARRMGARQDLDEGRFARAIVAEQCQHLAGADLQVDI